MIHNKKVQAYIQYIYIHMLWSCGRSFLHEDMLLNSGWIPIGPEEPKVQVGFASLVMFSILVQTVTSLNGKQLSE